ncbi:hypothetical protein IGI39_004825 [Enterococcus sp. AZ135]
MCKLLKVARSSYYYEAQGIQKSNEAELDCATIDEFYKSRRNYGTRKLKKSLETLGFSVSRRRIGRIMKKYNLVSNYTKRQFKKTKPKVNEAPDKNVLNREFTREIPLEVIITDLTYVRVKQSWHYICLLVDLYNREIIGYSSGTKKDAQLVERAFFTIDRPLEQVKLFHTDRGSEYDNKLIDEILESFDIKRSLSKKGCPHDNAVAESTYKSVKIEFVYQHQFESQSQLAIELFQYVYWWNHYRLHGSLNYQTPIGYRQINEKQLGEVK